MPESQSVISPDDLNSVLQYFRSQYEDAVSIDPLPGDRDRNFLLETVKHKKVILKISPPGEQLTDLDLQVKALDFLAVNHPDLFLPRTVKDRSGKDIIHVTDTSGRERYVRCLTYIPGTVCARFNPKTFQLRESTGFFAGTLDKALSGFSHAGSNRFLLWDARQARHLLPLLKHEKDPHLRRLLEKTVREFLDSTKNVLDTLPIQIIHNDFNDFNIIVTAFQNRDPEVNGVVDFGDMVRTVRVSEPAIAAAYAALGQSDPLGAICDTVRGYQQANPLTETEVDLLALLVRLRLATSLIMSAYQHSLEPDNSYHLISRAQALDAFMALDRIHPALTVAAVRDAAGFCASRKWQKILAGLGAQRKTFIPPLKTVTSAENIHVLDLSIGGRDATLPPARKNFSGEILRQQSDNARTLVVGRYNENRLCYTAPFFSSVAGNRTLHLGLDLFTVPGENIYAPTHGKIHSFADNHRPGDYGGTIILEHTLGQTGLSYYTLYGHLSRESLTGLKKGDPVARGEAFARVGAFQENGNWSPHLHFQVILDMLGMEGDFPGAAPCDQRSLWLQICPDPNLLVNLPESAFPSPPRQPEQIVHQRAELLGPSLSISYQRHLKIVRGSAQYLYAENGRRYLDAVNNVPHVGHCHPRVVHAAGMQNTVLNTNTRYLHDNLVAYAERLLALAPHPLEVCFFVNSGSEANDLALRLAWNFTGSREMLVLDSAYHGNLSSLIDISPYKFSGRGGRGCPEHTHVIPLPDPYRGPFKSSPECGRKYAEYVKKTLDELAEQNRKPAAFIAESLPGCGGQIVLPRGFLSRAYDFVRQNGALCIADEVQVGFGRVGEAFWGFETQNVVPDILTLGKPIGNGHPLAAVITTREIADAFATGMEYFNTFGGNPVSCAVGMAVLDVIEAEKLQQNALFTGNFLLDELRGLQKEFPLLGDVRGMGLFIGIELVRHRQTLEPADWEAAYITERMKDLGILISTDGPLHNVLKIKPPLVFSKENAAFLAESLRTVLKETVLRQI